jgi:membrane protein DedA with SNARE-associated domain
VTHFLSTSGLTNIIATSGIIAVFLLMTAESALIPIPSEVVMPFAGALAASHKMNFILAIVAGTLGNVVGSYIAWIIGRTGGRALVLRFGRYVRIREDDIDKAERWFAKRGEAAVLIGRLLPVVRTFISLPAGVAEMEPVRFGVFTFLGALPWSILLTGIGYAIGSNWVTLSKYVKYIGYVIALLVVALIIRFFAKRFSSSNK